MRQTGRVSMRERSSTANAELGSIVFAAGRRARQHPRVRCLDVELESTAVTATTAATVAPPACSLPFPIVWNYADTHILCRFGISKFPVLWAMQNTLNPHSIGT